MLRLYADKPFRKSAVAMLLGKRDDRSQLEIARLYTPDRHGLGLVHHQSPLIDIIAERALPSM